MKLKEWSFRFLVILYVISSGVGFYLNIQMQNWQGVKMGFVALLTPFLIPLLFRLCSWKMTWEVRIVNLVFVYFASLIGSCFHWYQLPYFDKILHFSSGLFGTILAVLLFCSIKQQKKIIQKQDHAIFLIFINAVNMSIALLWEFFEYLMLVLFNNDAINHYTTGVHDSITDMLCATIAGLFITFLVIRYYRNGKSNFFIQLYENMYDTNIGKQKDA